ncbi:hypothetical protein SAMN04489733_8022 [Amycolatopsis keratiniphila]|nr:hypothetical protein SAMN04489733_8022 [Amycolatopsis keratiniphila]
MNRREPPSRPPAVRPGEMALSRADLHAAVDAEILARGIEAGRSSADTSPSAHDVDRRASVAAATARAVAACVWQAGQPTDRPADWAGFGHVVPVLAASPGAGASVTAATVADALQIAGRSVLIVDTADPSRSGLSRASAVDGPQVPGPHPAIRIRFSWRAQALLARAETTLPVLAPGMLPPPSFWRPGPRKIDVTVVDIGHDPWRVGAHPLLGAGAWLRGGNPAPIPILAVRPSTPSLAHAEQILARFEAWNRLDAVTLPVQLVVVGARRWPATVTATAGIRVQKLIDSAIFLRPDPELAAHGVTAGVTPSRVRSAVLPMLRRLELLSTDKPSRLRTPGPKDQAREKGGRSHDRPHHRGMADPATGASTA